LRCEVHQLAAGPDGRCALCRTSLRAERKREGLRLGLGIMAGAALMIVALLGYGAFRRAERAPQERTVPAAEMLARSTTPRAQQSDPPASSAALEPPADPLPIPSPPSPPVAETPAASAAPAPSGVAAAGAPKPAGSARVVAGPTPEQIRAALVATPIVMFTADWCSVCRRAHAFLRANGLSCVDRDIDRDPAALRELKTRTGKTSVPTLEIDGELEQPGFSEQAVEHALARSVERRLGVTGLSIQR
jgi:glutaredoxin